MRHASFLGQVTGRPTAAQEREPLSDVGRVFDVLCAACANVATAALNSGASTGQAKADAGAPQSNSIPPGSPAVTADEMLVEVFSLLAEEAGIDGVYLRASLVEYLRAADAAGVPVPPALPVLLVRHSAIWRMLALLVDLTRHDATSPAGRAAGARPMRPPAAHVVAFVASSPCGTLICLLHSRGEATSDALPATVSRPTVGCNFRPKLAPGC